MIDLFATQINNVSSAAPSEGLRLPIEIDADGISTEKCYKSQQQKTWSGRWSWGVQGWCVLADHCWGLSFWRSRDNTLTPMAISRLAAWCIADGEAQNCVVRTGDLHQWCPLHGDGAYARAATIESTTEPPQCADMTMWKKHLLNQCECAVKFDHCVCPDFCREPSLRQMINVEGHGSSPLPAGISSQSPLWRGRPKSCRPTWSPGPHDRHDGGNLGMNVDKREWNHLRRASNTVIVDFDSEQRIGICILKWSSLSGAEMGPSDLYPRCWHWMDLLWEVPLLEKAFTSLRTWYGSLIELPGCGQTSSYTVGNQCIFKAQIK